MWLILAGATSSPLIRSARTEVIDLGGVTVTPGLTSPSCAGPC